MSVHGRIEHPRNLRVKLEDGRVMVYRFEVPRLRSWTLPDGSIVTEVVRTVRTFFEEPEKEL